ncbi:nucleotidyltransferase family protein [Pseudomonas sp. NPDC089396]|uniref:nucleotidyltransferase family protein n=1 Tax=Pseudomonas sp. NPDC089396 TaxID=3364461 RepID=UPI003836F432
MKPSNAIAGRTLEIKTVIEAYGFVSPKLFGSTARGQDRDGSDLDLLATIPPSKQGAISLFDIADLEDELAAMLGVSIDFNIETDIPEHLRSAIIAEAVEL